MNNPTLISEMQKFHFGGRIFCSDGEDGVLTDVVFDNARHLQSLGIRLGRLFGKTVDIPFKQVAEATGNGVTLNITRAELAAANRATREGILLDGHSTIQNTGSAAARGSLRLVAVEPGSGELAYVVAHNLRAGQDTLLRQDVITKLETSVISTALSEAALQTLPPYRSDQDLQQEVEGILFDLTPLHVDLRGMNIRVLDGVLYLDGNISSSLRSDVVQNQVSGIQGLLEVRNHLVGDDRLASDLAMALGRDPRTADLPIGVYPRLGNVRLSGAVHTAQQKTDAGEIAADFPGTRTVINDLIVNPGTDLLSVMASSAGGESQDKVPGKYIRHTK